VDRDVIRVLHYACHVTRHCSAPSITTPTCSVARTAHSAMAHTDMRLARTSRVAMGLMLPHFLRIGTSLQGLMSCQSGREFAGSDVLQLREGARNTCSYELMDSLCTRLGAQVQMDVLNVLEHSPGAAPLEGFPTICFSFFQLTCTDVVSDMLISKGGSASGCITGTAFLLFSVRAPLLTPPSWRGLHK
jgi:hypothetical protein